ncbi:MAG TPA: hypothetical protein VLW50_03175 [Streptosporangiaceae bacterium]|nr:hypothetical protein [Streptosporangiaceae bacterium]
MAGYNGGVESGGVEIARVADELYGLPPAEFTASRDERARLARAEGEKDLSEAIKKLRRPTASAALVNRLVREAGDQVDRLLDLGESMREAQQAMAGGRLRDLSAQRRPAIQALAQQARQLAARAGRPVSDQVEREVEATLEAALADPGAAEAVRSGRLTAGLRYAGFGGVDVADAVAVPAAPAQRTGRRDAGASRDRPVAREKPEAPGRQEREPAPPAWGARKDGAVTGQREDGGSARRRREVEAAEQDVRDAAEVARDAAAALDDASRRVTEASEARQAAERQIEDLEKQLERAQTREAEAARTLRDARRSRDAAARAADTAERLLGRFRAKLEAARKASPRPPAPPDPGA